MSMKTILFAMTAIALSGCVYPGITLNKGRLLDPTMDPAKTSIMADSMRSFPYKNFEQSSIGTGGASGGSCPTCK